MRVIWMNGEEIIDSAYAETYSEMVSIVCRWLNARTPLPGERLVFVEEL